MELMKGGKHPAAARNLAVKQLICSCGSNTFIAFPVVLVCYNALDPMQADSQPFGFEYKCKACGNWQALKHEQGKLPEWHTLTAEEKEANEAESFKQFREKAKA